MPKPPDPQPTTTAPAGPDTAPDTAAQWRTEWAVEVTWRDWRKAGAKGPTSQFGPFEERPPVDRFLEIQRRDRDVAATRVLTRQAAYTPWAGPENADPTSEEERDALLQAFYEQMTNPAAPTRTGRNDG